MNLVDYIATAVAYTIVEPTLSRISKTVGSKGEAVLLANKALAFLDRFNKTEDTGKTLFCDVETKEILVSVRSGFRFRFQEGDEVTIRNESRRIELIEEEHNTIWVS